MFLSNSPEFAVVNHLFLFVEEQMKHIQFVGDGKIIL
jgi:hypothetical protein